MKKTIHIIAAIAVFINLSAFTPQINNAAWSLLIPGTGLHKSGNSIAGFSFNAVEAAAIITTAVSYYTYSNYAQNALNFASLNLGKDISLYPDDMLGKLEYYDSSDEYNALLSSKARDIYPDDPAAQAEYIEKNWVPDSLSWEWDKTDTKEEFYVLRKNSRTYRQLFTVAGSAIIINHVLSAVISYIDTDSRFKNKIETAGFVYDKGFNLSMKVRF